LELLLCPVGLGSIKAIIGKTTTSEFGWRRRQLAADRHQ